MRQPDLDPNRNSTPKVVTLSVPKGTTVSVIGTFQKCPAKLTMFVDGGKADLALGCDEV
jgi:hypothetical protein